MLLYDIAWLAAADRPTNNEALNSDRPTTPQIHTFAAAGCCRRYHGTHTSGIFGAVWNNAAQTMNTGTAGVGTPRNLGVKPISCKFLGSAGTGYMSNAIICLNWCYSQGARITSNSWGNAAYSQVRAERGGIGRWNACALGSGGRASGSSSAHMGEERNILESVGVVRAGFR